MEPGLQLPSKPTASEKSLLCSCQKMVSLPADWAAPAGRPRLNEVASAVQGQQHSRGRDRPVLRYRQLTATKRVAAHILRRRAVLRCPCPRPCPETASWRAHARHAGASFRGNAAPFSRNPSRTMGGLFARLFAAFYAKEMEVVLVGLENRCVHRSL